VKVKWDDYGFAVRYVHVSEQFITVMITQNVDSAITWHALKLLLIASISTYTIAIIDVLNVIPLFSSLMKTKKFSIVKVVIE